MKNFLTRLLYGSFLINFTLPKKSAPNLALTTNKLLFEQAEQSDEIIGILPQMYDMAGQSEVSFKAIHNLSWLCDLMACSEIEEQNIHTLHNFLKDFILQYQRFDEELWALPLLSQRLFYGIHAFERLFREVPNLSFQEQFSTLLLKHAVFLRKKIKSHKNHHEYGMFLIRSAIACLVFRDERAYLQPTLAQIYNYLDSSFFGDGGHKSRNSSFHLRFLSELIMLRELLVKAGVSISPKLQTVIVRSCDYLEFLRHPDGKFAAFNGSFEGSKKQIETVFEQSPAPITPPQSCLKDAHYYRMRAENIFILADFYLLGQNDSFKRSYQGALSFEMSIGEQRVFVNCGSGEDLGAEWKTALYQSEAHNTISINKFKIVANAKKPEIPNKKHAKIISAITHQGVILEGTHAFEASDGQKQNFSFSHYRKILLHKNGHIVQGEDWVCIPKANFKKIHAEQSIELNVRFHLAPNIRAEISKTGSVVIHVPEEGHYIFNAGSGKISIEESVYTAAGYPKSSKQIIIRVNAMNEVTKIRWTMQTVQKKPQRENKAETPKHETDNLLTEEA